MRMELQLSKSLLREWRPEDEESLVRHADNIRIWNNLRDAFPHPYTREAAVEWIGTGSRRPGTLNFAIVAGGCAAGGIGLIFGSDIYRRSAEIGFWLGEEFWGKGIVTEAVQAVTKHAFSEYDLCRIFAGVFPWNGASVRVLEKSGFTFEARLRRHLTKNGESVDELIYALLKEE